MLSYLILSQFSFLCRSSIYCFGNTDFFFFLLVVLKFHHDVSSVWIPLPVIDVYFLFGNFCPSSTLRSFILFLLDNFPFQFSLLFFNSYLLCFLGYESWFLSLATFCYTFSPPNVRGFLVSAHLGFENPCLPPDDVSFSHSLHT